jgi:hypothetical protein
MENESGSRARRWPAWLNAAILLLFSWISIAALSFRSPPDTEVVAVVFPPWWNTQQSLQAAASANAGLVRTTAIPAILVVRPHEQAGLARLREAGAWFSIDPRAVAACLTLKG